MYHLNLLAASCCIALLTIAPLASAQKFQHTVGLGFVQISPQRQHFTATISPNRPPIEVRTPRDFSNYVSLMYHPAVSLKSWSKPAMTLRLGTPLTLSAFGRVSSGNGQTYIDDRNYFLLHLPFMAELAFGEASGPRKPEGAWNLGGFAGAGMSWVYFSARATDSKASNFNPCVSVGIRFRLSERLALHLAGIGNFLSVYEGPAAGESFSTDYTADGQVRSIRIDRQKDAYMVRSFNFGITFK